MRITHEFTVSVPPAPAWAVLTDLEAIAPCMPGAQLTGFDGETYQGKVRVKLGPVVSDFGGTARFETKDDATYHAVIDAKGKDLRGSGNASARITADLAPDPAGTRVSVDTDLSISGKVAQFGSSMIKQVSEKLLGEFTTCLEAKLAAGELGAQQVAAAESAPSRVDGDGQAVDTLADHVDSASASSESTEPAPLDLMHLAGGSVARRVLPALVVVVIVAVVIYFLVR
ncbi:membrane oxidoreductase [Kribbella pittospori]|uniref:Membrane oxidoreductase n=1 Tax=Kribbella pittospori TaxID=722689 RepID=A0A4R0KSC9_9ACTN|nr:SRPBCC family protein [Kribbella pittospori]TCC63330.1 membrane oxidoreductase [Kribbella pittospori]